MTNDPLDAMKARWNHIQGSLFPWLREEVDPITEALGRLVTTLDVIGLEAFVPEPPRGPGRPPEDRRALARAFVATAMLGVPTTNALIERLAVDRSLRRIPRLGAALASALGSHVFPRGVLSLLRSVEYMGFELGVLLEAEPHYRAKGRHATADSMKRAIE